MPSFLSHLSEFFVQFQNYSKSNPVIAGAVALWGATIITLVFRKAPTTLWKTFVRQITTTVTLDNEPRGWNDLYFHDFQNWLTQRKGGQYSRHYKLEATNIQSVDAAKLSPGIGRHYFLWRKRLFWVDRVQIENKSAGIAALLYQYRITTFGRSKKIFEAMIDEFRPVEDTTKISIYNFRYGDWQLRTNERKRHLSTLVYEQSIVDKIIKEIDHFRANRKYYEDRGFPYKLTFLLHSEPGTGKSSLVKAIASHYGMDIGELEINTLHDVHLKEAFDKAVTPILLMEDIDDNPATWRRDGVTDANEEIEEILTLYDLDMSSRTSPLGGWARPPLGELISPDSTMALEVAANNGLEPFQVAQCIREGQVVRKITKPHLEAVRNGKTSGVTLSGLLNALGGISYLDDKILFITTNRKHVLDPALIRPGRVDLSIEVKSLGPEEIKRYVKMMFPNETGEGDFLRIALINSLKFKPITGSRLAQLYHENKDDISKFLASIPKYSKTELEAQQKDTA